METFKKNNFTIGWREIGILLGGYFAAQIVLGFIMAFYIYVLKSDFQSSSSFLLIAYLLSLGLPILFFDLFVTRPKGYKLNFNFSSKPFLTYFLIFPMMFGMMLISEYLTNLIPTTGPFFGWLYLKFMAQMNSISVDHVAMLIMVAVFAPLLEEILFRGIILRAMLNKGMNPKKAIVFSALIFGAIHGYPWQFLGAFLLGLVLGLVYWKTESLLMSILLHAFNNFIAAMLIIFTKGQSFTQGFGVSEIYILLIGLVLFGTSYYYFMHRNKVVYQDN
ncbi:CPBP family intramembrane glutamic endopeptidase [Halpernia sp.]|uniref:CPBP family intramembrane glutamic endopeptidase n=1 Tax=Halpernia sp. TaxID=2782209 RepID=UPI003A952BA6